MSTISRKLTTSYPISTPVKRERIRKKWIMKYHVQTDDRSIVIVYGYQELLKELARTRK